MMVIYLISIWIAKWIKRLYCLDQNSGSDKIKTYFLHQFYNIRLYTYFFFVNSEITNND